MAIEIERKFVVAGDWPADAPGVRLRQGYLTSGDGGCTVRVRQQGERAFLCVKGAQRGISRAEFEYEVPPEDARAMLALCLYPPIDKTRYLVRVGVHTWEVDVFHGDNAGLVLAEIELEHETESFARPHWLGDEVSHDPRYRNAVLSRHPFGRWG